MIIDDSIILNYLGTVNSDGTSACEEETEMIVGAKYKVTILLKSGIILYSHHIQAVNIMGDMKCTGMSLGLEAGASKVEEEGPTTSIVFD